MHWRCGPGIRRRWRGSGARNGCRAGAAEAVASLRAAAANAPDHPGIAVWLGHALEDTGEAEAALEAYARAHALAPDEPQLAAYLLAWRRKLCDWRDLDALARAGARCGATPDAHRSSRSRS